MRVFLAGESGEVLGRRPAGAGVGAPATIIAPLVGSCSLDGWIGGPDRLDSLTQRFEGDVVAIYDHTVRALDGSPADLSDHRDKVALVVNVASKCGLTPQYEGLQRLYDQYGDRGFTVLGFPCNQFLEQEPGSAEEIQEFCSVNYGVSFPLYEKIEVNGDDRHPLYAELTEVSDAEGTAGDIQWNFEKFVVVPGGDEVVRFRPTVEPEADEITAAIEANLPG
jgi:glutathione peroxidase